MRRVRLHGRDAHRACSRCSSRRRAPGPKFQQDAQLGQASIFDLEEPAPGGVRGGGLGGAPDLPVPALPDERPQLNTWEKESLGLFLSSHPLKEVRAALRQEAECQLGDLKDRKDGDWVTVGGMITECKKIRTRKGDPMAFATLDDLTGQVEMLVFNDALREELGHLMRSTRS